MASLLVLCTYVCRSLEEQNQELQEQVILFKETVKVKDDVVINLTNQIFALENKGQLPRE